VRPLLAVMLTFMLVMLVLSAACRSMDQTDGADHRRIETEVLAFLSHYAEAIAERDEPALRALYVNDDRFAWHTDGELTYTSADDVIASLRSYPGVRFDTTFSNVIAIPLGGTRVSVRTAFDTTMEIPGADDHTYSGVTTLLLEKQRGGWHVLEGHSSTSGGPPSR
jgi:hypothetical protein